MREISTHKVMDLDGNNPIDYFGQRTRLEAVDDVDIQTKSNHHYEAFVKANDHAQKVLDIRFHKGPVKEYTPNGGIVERPINGVTEEVLLAVVLDRLEALQKGKFQNKDFLHAINGIRVALNHLHHRIEQRVNRGVDGFMEI